MEGSLCFQLPPSYMYQSDCSFNRKSLEEIQEWFFQKLLKLHNFAAGDSKAAAKAPFVNKRSGINNSARIISSELLSIKDEFCIELCAPKILRFCLLL